MGRKDMKKYDPTVIPQLVSPIPPSLIAHLTSSPRCLAPLTWPCGLRGRLSSSEPGLSRSETRPGVQPRRTINEHHRSGLDFELRWNREKRNHRPAPGIDAAGIQTAEWGEITFGPRGTNRRTGASPHELGLSRWRADTSSRIGPSAPRGPSADGGPPRGR
jgi:hypothetical protein